MELLKPPPHHTAPLAAADGPSVLLAEDDEDVRRLTTHLLERDGYRVTSAADGETALRLARELLPDVVLLDVSMPGRDGFDVCRAIVESGPHAPPVIFLSAHGEIEARVAGLDLGAADYIVKPYAPAELRARVRAASRAKAWRDALLAQAATDPLTGLPNRRHFDSRAAEAVAIAQRHATPLACLLLDVDHFKRVNDTHGHPAGDCVLREVAHRIRTTTRATDTAARYGGEEFAVLLPDADASGALAAGEKLRAAIAARPVPLGPAPRATQIEVRVSVGAAAWCDGMRTAADLLASADAALYAAKRQGRNRVLLATEPQHATGHTAHVA